MTPVIVRARAIRWESEAFPAWVEVRVVDADGREHRIVEKVPVLTSATIDSGSLPAELWISGEAAEVDTGRVRTTLACAVETTAGLTELHLSVDDIVWM